MSTRSCLAYKKGKGWKGVYCHWGGYPTNRGQQIWEIIMQKFLLNKGRFGVTNEASREQKLQAFVDIYIKGHPGGWSVFPEQCYCHDPDFVMRDGLRESILTNKTANALFIEWVYVIDIKKGKLIIYASGKDKSEKDKYKHYKVTEIELNPDSPEPDWKEIERMGMEIVLEKEVNL